MQALGSVVAENPILSLGQERLIFPFFVAALVKFQVMENQRLRQSEPRPLPPLWMLSAVYWHRLMAVRS